MRVVWNRRLYQCASCNRQLFIRPTDVLFRRAEETVANGSTTAAAT
jgi:hypothetical protein